MSDEILDLIISDAEYQEKRLEDAWERKGMLSVKTAERWMEQSKNTPIPKMLFGEFWFEGELCILFVDTNLGKSILAVQIGDSISRSQPIPGFTIESPPQPVLYFDFELSAKQFENRYSINFARYYTWHSNFIRVEIDHDVPIPKGYSNEQYLLESIDKSIRETKAKVLIIDNLTYLRAETEKARDALPLMKELKALKSKYGLSILALAHTPKRDLSKTVTRNDLQGSKMLINFCDSSFAIGESHTDTKIRYIKQIKARNCEVKYDSGNIIVCQIDKPNNFLQFEFLNFGHEWEHLKEMTPDVKEQRIYEAVELKKQGLSNKEIAQRFSVSEGAVRKWIKKAVEGNSASH